MANELLKYNLLKLTTTAELVEAEERIGKRKARELFESGRLKTPEVGTFSRKGRDRAVRSCRIFCGY